MVHNKGSGSICLLTGTLVATPSGHARPIERLRVGDLVLGLAPGRAIPTPVTFVMTDHWRSYRFALNGALHITNDHPVLVHADGRPVWRRVDRLQCGDQLVTASGRMRLTRIEPIEQPAPTVYIETVAGSYITAGESGAYVVHGAYMHARRADATAAGAGPPPGLARLTRTRVESYPPLRLA